MKGLWVNILFVCILVGVNFLMFFLGREVEHHHAQQLMLKAAGQTGADPIGVYTGNAVTRCIYIEPYTPEEKYFFHKR